MGLQISPEGPLRAGCLLFARRNNQLDQAVDIVFRITIFLFSTLYMTSYIWVSFPLLILAVSGLVSLYLTLLFMIRILLRSSSILIVMSLLMLA